MISCESCTDGLQLFEEEGDRRAFVVRLDRKDAGRHNLFRVGDRMAWSTLRQERTGQK